MMDSIHALIDSAGKRQGIATADLEKLKHMDNEHVFDILLENGKSFKAFRVQHSNKRGPYKGGIRFHKNVDLEEVHTLATLMSLKTAAIDIPMGGGKGGVAVDPRELDKSELEELSRKYVEHLHPYIGPDKDVPAPDVNTNAQIIDWMLDEFQKQTGNTSKAAFTGKSLGNGGSLGREAATGRGGVIALSELLSLEGKAEQSITMAIQGFGNVGSFFGTVAQEMRPQWKLVAVSDSEAAVYDENGLKASALQEFKAGRGRFKDYRDGGAKVISNDELLALDVDVLVLAGIENSVTESSMKDIRAPYIVEMGNGPITGEAQDYLNKEGKIILPDIIANAGGVLVSYFEWLQNKQDEHWDEAVVNERLSEQMKRAVTDMYKIAKEHDISLKEAAFMMAIKRLVS